MADIILDNIFKKAVYFLGYLFVVILTIGFVKGLLEGLSMI